MGTRRLYMCALILAVAAAWSPEHASAEAISTTRISPSSDWHLGNTLITDHGARPDKAVDSSFAPVLPLTFEGLNGRYPTEYIWSNTDFTAIYSLGKTG